MVNKKKLSKLGVFIVGMIVMSGISLAVWMVLTGSAFTGHVVSTSGSPVTASISFQDLNIDTTASAQNLSTIATFENSNGDLDLVASIIIEKTDVLMDGCSDYVDDCRVDILDESGNTIEDGDTISFLPQEIKTFTAYLGCARLSCPQDVWVNLTLA